MISMPPRGLYAITDPHSCQRLGIEKSVRLALEGGAKVVQYRDKSADPFRRKRESSRLLTLCHDFGVPLIINDDVELAAEIGADGVHLGKDDRGPREAREILDDGVCIGVSCYNSIELAGDAVREGADYVAFGRFFPSGTKPEASPADLETLRANRDKLKLPVAAIGGITPRNAPALLAAGVDLLAVIGAVFGQENPTTAARQFARLFDQAD